MILVLLGTKKLQFTRLLTSIENCLNKGYIKEEVFVQAGYTKYYTKKMNIVSFIDRERLSLLYDEAKYIITHAGTGSVVQGLKKNKKVIAVPRYKYLNEHVNNHQVELANVFSEKGYVKSCYVNDDLCEIVKGLNSFEPKQYMSKKNEIIKCIDEYIESI